MLLQFCLHIVNILARFMLLWAGSQVISDFLLVCYCFLFPFSKNTIRIAKIIAKNKIFFLLFSSKFCIYQYRSFCDFIDKPFQTEIFSCCPPRRKLGGLYAKRNNCHICASLTTCCSRSVSKRRRLGIKKIVVKT